MKKNGTFTPNVLKEQALIKKVALKIGNDWLKEILKNSFIFIKASQ